MAIISIFLVLLVILPACWGGKSPTHETLSPSPRIVGEWNVNRAPNARMIQTGTTGEIEGKSYLFLMISEGGSLPTSALVVFDLKAPTKPTEVGRLEAPGRLNGAAAIELSAKTLNVASPGCFWTVDLSNPAMPKPMSMLNTESFTTSMASSGQYVYLGDATGINVIDTSNPLRPRKIRSLAIRALRLKALGQLLFSDYLDALYIIDISSPSSPKVLSRYDSAAGPLRETWPQLVDEQDLFWDIAVEGKYVYVASGVSGLHVLDVSRPDSPQEIANLKGQGFASHVFAYKNLVLFTNGAISGTVENKNVILCLVDVTDPREPRDINTLELKTERPDFVGANDYSFTGSKSFIYGLNIFKVVIIDLYAHN